MTIRMLLLVTCGGSIFCGPGQTAQPALVIDGRVQDSVTARPISQAAITVSEVVRNAGVVQWRDPNATVNSARAVPHSAASGIDGSFTLTGVKPGQYIVKTSLDGYVESSQVITIGPDQPALSMKILLEKKSTLSGGLFDIKLRKPVAGITVHALAAWFVRGKSVYMPSASAVTSTSGAFRIDGLPAGEYALEITPPLKETISIRKSEEPAATKELAQPRGYRRSLNAGDSPEYTPRLKLFAGTDLDIGNVPIAQEPLYQIRGNITADGCSSSDSIVASLTERYGSMYILRTSGKLPCDSPFVVSNLAPGSYELRMWVQGKPLSERASAYTEARIQNRDAEVTLKTVSPIAVTGRLEFADSHAPSKGAIDFLSKLRVHASHLRSVSFADEQPVSVSSKGEFHLALLPTSKMKLGVLGVPPPYYVKDVFYNGARASHSVFDVDVYAPAHALRIVLGGDGATISGIAKAADKTMAEARVIVVPWPVVYEDDGFPLFNSAMCDPSGRFEFKGVAPGVYRLIAVAASEHRRIHEPDVLTSLVPGAQELRIGASDSKTVVVDAGRR